MTYAPGDVLQLSNSREKHYYIVLMDNGPDAPRKRQLKVAAGGYIDICGEIHVCDDSEGWWTHSTHSHFNRADIDYYTKIRKTPADELLKRIEAGAIPGFGTEELT